MVAGVRGALAFGLGLMWVPVFATAQSVTAHPEAHSRSAAARAAAGAIAAVDAVDAADIVERALDRASRQRKAALDSHFEYVTAGTVESLDAAGNVTRTETRRHLHYPLDGHFYSEVIGRDGRSLDAGDARDEREAV